MRYRGILMDADDTLFDFKAANRASVGQLLDELGYRHPDRYEQYQAINHVCWHLLEDGKMTPGELKVARWARFFTQYNLPFDAVAAAERFVQLLGGQSMLLPGAEDAARAIAAKLPIVILTNGITSVQRSRLACSPLRDIVSDVVISEEVGAAKPDPRIFGIALDRLGICPDEALMIGDSITSDVIGANRAGVDVCFFNPAGKTLPPGVHAEYEVKEIGECVGIALGS